MSTRSDLAYLLAVVIARTELPTRELVALVATSPTFAARFCNHDDPISSDMMSAIYNEILTSTLMYDGLHSVPIEYTQLYRQIQRAHTRATPRASLVRLPLQRSPARRVRFAVPAYQPTDRPVQ